MKLLLTVLVATVSAATAFAQQKEITVSGITTEGNGELLIATVVKSLRTGTVVMSNIDGRYSIEAALGDTLIFHPMVGYYSQEQIVTGPTMDVGLLEDPIESHTVLTTGAPHRTKQMDLVSPHLRERLIAAGMAYGECRPYTLFDRESTSAQYASDKSHSPLRRLGPMDARLIHEGGECEVFIYIVGAWAGHEPGSGEGYFNGERIRPTQTSYDRIKNDLMYGHRGAPASEMEIRDLEDKVIVQYPDWGQLFHANYLIEYPFVQVGNEKYGDLVNGRVFVLGKDGVDVFVYFFMTNEFAAKNRYNKPIFDLISFWFDNDR